MAFWNFDSKDIKKYKAVVRENPEDAGAHFYLAAAYEQKERFPEALAEFEESLRINPNSAVTHFNLGILYEKVGDGRNAIVHITKAGSLFAERSDLHNKERARKRLRDYYKKFGFKPEEFEESR